MKGFGRDARASKDTTRLNEKITSKQVRLIGADGAQLGVIATKDALAQAQKDGLDLVEVAGNSEAPVCKILDYGKFKYHEQKKASQTRKNQVTVNTKEITLRPVTEENDYQVKLKKMINFLLDGDKLKVTMRFRGREVAHKEIGMKVMVRIEKDLAEYGKIDSRPKMEGRLMGMAFSSLSQKKSKSAKENEKKMAGE